MTTAPVETRVPPLALVNQPLKECPVRETVGRSQTGAPSATSFVPKLGVPPPLASKVATYCLGAEQDASVAGAFEQVQEYAAAAGDTDEAVPTAQRFEAGAETVATPFAVPQAGSWTHPAYQVTSAVTTVEAVTCVPPAASLNQPSKA